MVKKITSKQVGTKKTAKTLKSVPYSNFSKWLNKNKHIEWSTDDINNFIIKINKFLSKNNICFLNGSYLFEDIYGHLFNLLAFNQLEKDYNCVDNKDGKDGKDSKDGKDGKDGKDNKLFPKLNELTTIRSSITHRKHLERHDFVDCIPYESKRAKKALSCRKSKDGRYTCLKFERLFSNDKKTIDYLCNYCDDNKNEYPENIASKRVILFYPFTHRKTQTLVPSQSRKEISMPFARMLFLKMEEYDMNDIHHAYQFIKGVIKPIKYKNKYPTRKEGSIHPEKYEKYNEDLEFYKNNFPKEVARLEFYNKNIRIGNEFFISQGMIEYFLMQFLNTNKPCDKDTV